MIVTIYTWTEFSRTVSVRAGGSLPEVTVSHFTRYSEEVEETIWVDPTVNWTAVGSVLPEAAKQYAQAILAAVEVARHLPELPAGSLETKQEREELQKALQLIALRGAK